MSNVQSGEDRLLLAVRATPWQGRMAVRLNLEELIVLLLLPFILPFPLYIAQNPRFQVRKLGFQISREFLCTGILGSSVCFVVTFNVNMRWNPC